MKSKFENAGKFLVILVISLYRKLISPFLPNTCRFYPSCSEYSISVLRKFGIIKGTLLSIRRILRCNPFSAGGYDPP